MLCCCHTFPFHFAMIWFTRLHSYCISQNVATVTVITLVLLSVITVSLLWCSIDKYTNYCRNYCSVIMKLLSNYCTVWWHFIGKCMCIIIIICVITSLFRLLVLVLVIYLTMGRYVTTDVCDYAVDFHSWGKVLPQLHVHCTCRYWIVLAFCTRWRVIDLKPLCLRHSCIIVWT